MTGITGFIGKRLAQRLIEQGYEVSGMHRINSNIDLLKVPAQAKLFVADLNNQRSMENAIKEANPEVIVHLAALSSGGLSFNFPEEYLQTNEIGTFKLLSAIKNLKGSQDINTAKLVFAGSMEVYGYQNSNEPFSETLELGPASSPYGLSKQNAERVIEYFAQAMPDVKMVIMRTANTYGREGAGFYLIEYIIDSLLNKNDPKIKQPLDVRDFIFIDDHIDAYVKAIEKDCEGIFNIGAGLQLNNGQLQETISKLMKIDNKKPGQRLQKQKPTSNDRPKQECFLSVRYEKASKNLGWSPLTTLDEGLRKTIKMREYFFKTKN
ncbi:MAG TPA: NAD-dependent epimerase/dehydratase family protein [bacterium]|nr:NAD-dependent epimerase/dehydratase family protein [bacterium]